MDRRYECPLPAAWRGVASSRYMRLARFLSLVEELGGMRGHDPHVSSSLGGVLNAKSCHVGTMDMTLAMLSQETAPARARERARGDALREFMTAELSRHERLVLMLFYADGLSLDEIAVVLDLPAATVAQLFERTLDTLEQRLRLGADECGSEPT